MNFPEDPEFGQDEEPGFRGCGCAENVVSPMHSSSDMDCSSGDAVKTKACMGLLVFAAFAAITAHYVKIAHANRSFRLSSSNVNMEIVSLRQPSTISLEVVLAITSNIDIPLELSPNGHEIKLSKPWILVSRKGVISERATRTGPVPIKLDARGKTTITVQFDCDGACGSIEAFRSANSNIWIKAFIGSYKVPFSPTREANMYIQSACGVKSVGTGHAPVLERQGGLV